MTTLQDAVELYKLAQAMRDDETRTYEQKKITKEIERISHAFKGLGLTPKQVTPHSVLFDFNDEVIELRISHWSYGHTAACLVLPNCPDCNEEMVTDPHCIDTLEEIGSLLVNRSPAYHDCEAKYRNTPNLIVTVEQSISEQFITLLEAYIDERVSNSFAVMKP